MDCQYFVASAARRALSSFPYFLLSLSLGCTTFKGSTVETTQPAPEPTPVAVKKKDKEGSKRDYLLGIADFRVQAADDKELSPPEARSLRDKARKDYQEVITLDPKCQRAYLGLGRLYQSLDDPERALATYQKGSKELPKSAVLCYEAGMCQAKRKKWDEAIAKLRAAHDLDLENRVYINALGFTLARAGELDDSYAFFEKTLGEARAHYNLARVMRHLDRPDECQEHLRLALEAKPDMEEAKQFLNDLQNPPAESSDRLDAQVSFEDTGETVQAEQK